MSSVTPTFVHAIAESINFQTLSKDAAESLGPHLEVRLREIIQDALRFMRRSKRHTLSPDDINSALIAKSREPIYGYGGRTVATFAAPEGMKDCFYIPDPYVDLREELGRRLSKCPVEAGLFPHWLMINGKQPAIPENAPVERRQPPAKRRKAAPAQKPGPGKEDTLAAAEAEHAQQQQPVLIGVAKHVLSEELLLYLNRAKALVAGESLAAPGKADSAVKSRKLELGLLASLANDPGLNPLVPYMSKMLAEQVKRSLKSVKRLSLLLKVIRSLLQNEQLALDNYLQQIIPVLLTCVVAKELGSPADDDHWSVRDLAAATMGLLLEKFSEAYPELLSRVSSQLLRGLLDHNKPLTTHYGAIRCLTALGARAAGLLLVPHIPAYCAALDGVLEGSQSGSVRRSEAEHVHAALLQGFAVAWQGSAVAKDFRSFLVKQHSSPKRASLKGPRLALPPMETSCVKGQMSDKQIAPLAETSKGMLGSTEDAVAQSVAAMSRSDDAAEVPDSLALSSNDQPAMAHPVISGEGTLVSAESLNAAYRALGLAALSVVHGNHEDDPVL